MIRIYKFLILVFVLFFNPFYLEGAPLSHYRQKMGTENQKEAVQERLQKIRELLGTHSRNWKLFEGKTYPIELTRVKRLSSSSFFKQLLEKGVRFVQDEERYVSPLPFNPSTDTPEDVETREKEKRKKLFEVSLGDLKQSFDSIIFLAKKTQKNENAPTLDEVKLTRMIASSMDNAIQQKLGRLTFAETNDGYVIRLHFQKDQTILKMGLSMLITYRTREDPYYLELLHFFEEQFIEAEERLIYKVDKSEQFTLDRKGERIKNNLTPKEQERLENLRYGKGFIQKTLQGAEEAHAALALLSAEEVHFLIDLFFEMQRNEIPVSSEIEPLIQISADTQKEFEKLIHPNELVFQQKQSVVEQIAWDISVYKQRFEEISKLEKFLIREKNLKKIHQEHLEEIRK